ncbi:tyrosine-type recombinase/integrase [Sulfurimonas sp.]|uniref:tyrosine-type recombinase/integrase n=1 Tax=Sulfurimonas sp. TaxID=2022749 RepID=UPI0025DB3B07|nr:tyrosine-type recombinase/integrase [Sulfurimonas sp.]MBW6487532.1 tyrosine-type recombinase/integrase [Sulfurimonas sp.]
MTNTTFCQQIETYAKSLQTKLKIEKKSKNTISSYMQTYKSFIEFCKQHYKELSFQNLREDDIYAFIEYKSATMNKQGDIATSTANGIISHLKRLFKHIERNATDEAYNFDKVFEDIKLKQPKRVPKGIDGKEVKKILTYLESLKQKEIFTNFRNIMLFKLMLFGGLRASEAVSIKLSDINLTEEGDLYKITFKGKGDKSRFTYIDVDAIEDEINMFVNVFKLSKDEFISKTSTGKHMDRIQLSKMVNSVYKRADVDISGVHILRHTAAKKLKTQVPLEVLKNLLGHSSIETTSIYINPTEDMVKKQMSGVKLYGL